MNGFEKIDLYRIEPYGVYFTVEENPLLIDFEEKLMSCDYVFVEPTQAKKMFDKRSKFEEFARGYGFRTIWDTGQNCFVCTKEMPWIE